MPALNFGAECPVSTRPDARPDFISDKNPCTNTGRADQPDFISNKFRAGSACCNTDCLCSPPWPTTIAHTTTRSHAMLKRRFDAAHKPPEDEEDDQDEAEIGTNLDSFQQRFAQVNYVFPAKPGTVASVADGALAAQALRDIGHAKESAVLSHRRRLLLLLGLGLAGVHHFEHLSNNPRRSPAIVQRKAWSQYVAGKTATRGSYPACSLLMLIDFTFLLSYGSQRIFPPIRNSESRVSPSAVADYTVF